MPKNWITKRIGDVCKTNQQTYSLSEKWPFVNYLDTGNLTENRIDEVQHIIIGQDILPSRAKRKIEVDDILYSTVRPNQRHYGIVREVLPNMLVSTGFAVITADKARANADFLYYYLAQNDIVDSLHAIGEQSVSAYPSIKPSDIEGLELDLPPLSEQIEIGRILRALDDKITNNTKINHHLVVRSVTDSSPDISRGKSTSRVLTRAADSSVRLIISSKSGRAESLKLFKSSIAGTETGSRLNSPKLMYFCVLPANRISMWFFISELRKKHSTKYTKSIACEVLNNPTFFIAKLMSRSMIKEISPIVPIILMRMSNLSTLLRSLILLKSTLLMRLGAFKSTPYGKRCFDVTRGKPCSVIFGESCVPSLMSISSPSGVVVLSTQGTCA